MVTTALHNIFKIDAPNTFVIFTIIFKETFTILSPVYYLRTTHYLIMLKRMTFTQSYVLRSLGFGTGQNVHHVDFHLANLK